MVFLIFVSPNAVNLDIYYIGFKYRSGRIRILDIIEREFNNGNMEINETETETILGEYLNFIEIDK